MTTPTPARPAGARETSTPEPRAPLVTLGLGAAWLLGLSAACQIVVVMFRSNPMATAVVQAVVVDLAMGPAGVRWDPGAGEKGEAKRALSGIGIGAAVALGVTAAAIGASVALGWAKVAAHGPNASLGLGLLRGAAIGVRDTLLYAGLPLAFAARAGIPRVAGVVFGALAAGAAIALLPAATPANVALAVAVGAAVAGLWARSSAGWLSVGLAGGWAFFAGAVLRGGLFDTDWKRGALGPGFVADGAPAWVAAGLFVAVAVWSLRGTGAGSAPSAPQTTATKNS